MELKDFIELKSEKVTYVGKTYTLYRYLSVCAKAYIESWNGYVTCFFRLNPKDNPGNPKSVDVKSIYGYTGYSNTDYSIDSHIPYVSRFINDNKCLPITVNESHFKSASDIRKYKLTLKP